MKGYISRPSGVDLEYQNAKKRRSDSFVSAAVKSDEVYELIFAPNPETGKPDSTLGVYLNTQNQEVRDLIASRFENRGTGNHGVDDPDVALDTVKLRSETNEAYINRLRELSRSYVEKEKKSNSNDDEK